MKLRFKREVEKLGVTIRDIERIEIQFWNLHNHCEKCGEIFDDLRLLWFCARCGIRICVPCLKAHNETHAKITDTKSLLALRGKG